VREGLPGVAKSGATPEEGCRAGGEGRRDAGGRRRAVAEAGELRLWQELWVARADGVS
jgi:hypothetical protein